MDSHDQLTALQQAVAVESMRHLRREEVFRDRCDDLWNALVRLQDQQHSLRDSQRGISELVKKIAINLSLITVQLDDIRDRMDQRIDVAHSN